MKKPAIALVLVFTAVLAACGSDDSSSPAAAATTAKEITVKSNEFVPPALTIKVGESVTWKWAGGTHNVVSGANCTSDNAYTSGAPVGTTGNTFTRVFDKAGTFEYFCSPHCLSSGMKGTVTVQ